MSRNKHKWRPVRLTILLMGLYLLQSCGPSILTPVGPEDTDAEESYFSTVKPIGKKSNPVWYAVVTEIVDPGKKTKIKGSRYTLEFDGDEITAPVTVIIEEHDNGIVDVKFDPEGAVVLAPVRLEINYAGTRNDPTHPENKGTPLTVFEHKNSTWIPVPGEPKAGQSKTRVMDITTLNRFAMWDGAGGPQVENTRPVPDRPRENVRTP